LGLVSVIIPARYGATRFPGKSLALLAGKPLICHVVERALAARGVDLVVVATDDDRIAAVARVAGAVTVMTGEAATGTDRVAEAARRLSPRPALVVNLQGDEPLIEPAAIEALLAVMSDPAVKMATLARPGAGAARARGVARAASCARGGASHPGGRDAVRRVRGGHARGSGARTRAPGTGAFVGRGWSRVQGGGSASAAV
jgi:3-deoxy-manno-octulosonate cytidylyltransferase (CMP-KDO synthetase)